MESRGARQPMHSRVVLAESRPGPSKQLFRDKWMTPAQPAKLRSGSRPAMPDQNLSDEDMRVVIEQASFELKKNLAKKL